MELQQRLLGLEGFWTYAAQPHLVAAWVSILMEDKVTGETELAQGRELLLRHPYAALALRSEVDALALTRIGPEIVPAIRGCLSLLRY
jgi:hypothetical protein